VGGLVVPQGQSELDPLAGTYLTLGEYLDFAGADSGELIRFLADQHERDEMVSETPPNGDPRLFSSFGLGDERDIAPGPRTSKRTR
jgi:hypothetical protein